MARFCPLFSGSSGNCSFIGAAGSGILVDAGVSAKRILAALSAREISKEEINAIFITHEHSDHIKGLGVLVKKLDVPIFASPQTLDAVSSCCALPEGARLCAIEKDTAIGDIIAHRFPTSHDCEGSSGYSFTLPFGQKISVCTDTGIVTEEMRSSISGSNLVLIESNHDLTMLKSGPYPPLLKIRIMSEKGHLSNNECAAALPELLNSGTTSFVLGHLSEHNNTPDLAVAAARGALLGVGAKHNEDYRLFAAPPEGSGVIAL